MQNEVVEVWPENHGAVEVFRRMTRQWVMGVNGPTGLNLQVVPLFMRALKLPRDSLLDILDALSVMENEALQILQRD